LPTECQIIKVPLYTECYLLPTECQIIKVPLYTECYLLPSECQIIKVPMYSENQKETLSSVPGTPKVWGWTRKLPSHKSDTHKRSESKISSWTPWRPVLGIHINSCSIQDLRNVLHQIQTC
jgi:hypothetical protein